MNLRALFCLAAGLAASAAGAADWPQFRGPGGLGITNDKNLPASWNDKSNVLWKAPLPGPGSSSPIVVGDRVFVTCYSGYGLSENDPGDVKNLKRHLLCLDRQGKVLWTRDVVAKIKDHPF